LTDRRPIDRGPLGVVDGVTVCVPNIRLADRSWRTRADAVTGGVDLISCGLKRDLFRLKHILRF
jgi:hypothetical protein